MVRRCLSLLLLLISTLAASRVLGNDVRWRPQATWVFVVGTLEWKDSETFASFPKDNRRDAQLVRFFRQKGVTASHIVYLADKQATTWRSQAALDKMLAQTAPGDLLFFYFTGHGYQSDDEKKTFFATYDASDDRAGWSVDTIVGTIAKKFRGDRVILAADCCFSGALVDRVRRTHSRQSFACFASSTSKDSSTANWTFTEMLLAGLQGRSFADLNGDGRVSLGEIARGVRDDMRFAEDQNSVSVLTGQFHDDTMIAPAARKTDAAVGRRVEVKSEGDWYKARIIAAKNRQYRVHYYGYEVAEDEWVGVGALRKTR
ncbi:MAG: hypothetical protein QOK37_3711 [Thermoanaerobaculia bacterium]|jgi:hypothetical protein|nr:hypothetical protein [Thermoanaerobaculia bacterium]